MGWTYRSADSLVFGRLLNRELSALGVGVPTPQPTTASPQAEELDNSERESPAPTDTASDLTLDLPETLPLAEMSPEAALTAHRGRIEALITDLEQRLGRFGQIRRTARAGDAAAQAQSAEELAQASRELTQRMEEIQSEIEALQLPHTDFSGSQQYLQPQNRARHLIREIRYILDPSVERPRTAAQERALEMEQSTPLERRSAADARATLEEEDILLGEAPLSHRNWERRVGGEGATAEDIRERAEIAASQLTSLRDRMEFHRERLHQAIRARDAEAMTAALNDLAKEGFAHDQNWQPPRQGRDERLRRAWQPERRPALLNPGPSDPVERRRIGGLWHRWLNNTIRSLGGAQQGEIHRMQGYATQDPTRIGNEQAVEVDFHRTGVTITNNYGNPLNTAAMRLDPQFAEAMLRFIRQVQGLGVEEIWTAGFLRSPISPADTHPRGQACDITGFVINGELLHLRSGRPMDMPNLSDSAAMALYNDIRRGHSDWFDHTGEISGMTHEAIFHGITSMMRTYFSTIVGPGNDQSHMGHWHVELATSGRGGPQVRAQMLDRDQPDWVRDPADSHAPEWMTPSERASFAD